MLCPLKFARPKSQVRSANFDIRQRSPQVLSQQHANFRGEFHHCRKRSPYFWRSHKSRSVSHFWVHAHKSTHRQFLHFELLPLRHRELVGHEMPKFTEFFFDGNAKSRKFNLAGRYADHLHPFGWRSNQFKPQGRVDSYPRQRWYRRPSRGCLAPKKVYSRNCTKEGNACGLCGFDAHLTIFQCPISDEVILQRPSE